MILTFNVLRVLTNEKILKLHAHKSKNSMYMYIQFISNFFGFFFCVNYLLGMTIKNLLTVTE